VLPALFLAVIGLVLACTDWTGRSDSVSRLEMRPPAPMPALPHSLSALAAYPEKFGAFFADHFGLRRQMIALRSRIALKLLRKSTSPVVVVGSGGWLFYSGDRSIENYLRQAPFSTAELDEWATRLHEREAWFAARGIAYLFVVAPDKQTVYPEYMPRSLEPGPGAARLDQLVARLAGGRAENIASGADAISAGGDALLDLRATLVNAKRDGQLYFMRDSHWNDRGAYRAYRAIVRRLSLPALPRDARTLGRYTLSPDLARLSGANETDTDTTLITRCAVPAPAALEAGVFDRGHPGRYPTGAYDIPPTVCPRGRARLVMFHDSFADALAPYLSETFARAVYVRRQPTFAQTQQMVAAEHPTVVIEERVERQLIEPLLP